ncbi:OsmC family protein [Flavobacterium beibuense]|uniref:OsmC family protein n=1 Tax=Flavobacterium beibuense TaxID=657326 RepID=UPI003A937BE3|tara:strand:- start:2306 stop:2758 length:453 start_codon:yes stop_codon:yes gene_type:complete
MSDENKKKIVHIHLSKNDVFKSTLTAGNHSFIADEPTSVDGGNDEGPDPYDLLLMSLGSCTLMTVKMYARRKKWPIEDMFLELRHNKRHVDDCQSCEDSSAKIDLIEKELIIKGDLTQEQLDKLLEISKKCPVHRTLLGEMRIESSLTSE